MEIGRKGPAVMPRENCLSGVDEFESEPFLEQSVEPACDPLRRSGMEPELDKIFTSMRIPVIPLPR